MKENPFDLFTNEYENWFKENELIFQSELLALKQVIPIEKVGIEIGVGSGIFAEKLNIKFGIDPSEKMLNYATQRKLTVKKGFAEDLPYPDKSFDFAVFITSICFVDNPEKAIKEAHRIIKDNGDIIIAFIDKESSLGKSLEREKEDNKFYRHAKFYSVSELTSMIVNNHFEITEIIQTLTETNLKIPENPMKGHGKGSFVVIKGRKLVPFDSIN
ncbi:MAG: class I SAM-dependent methyltransferase [Bacteroidales bacterium]|jgi:ubiquinone/menaquinone biosynthesis C-methylase UbiE|nr:class I SAM-dependent methyltransferase [Mariniphaga sp.]NLB93739.1 class I SAM-dependent methyltransferase [Bacteroidales bacterium]